MQIFCMTPVNLISPDRLQSFNRLPDTCISEVFHDSLSLWVFKREKKSAIYCIFGSGRDLVYKFTYVSVDIKEYIY